MSVSNDSPVRQARLERSFGEGALFVMGRERQGVFGRSGLMFSAPIC